MNISEVRAVCNEHLIGPLKMHFYSRKAGKTLCCIDYQQHSSENRTEAPENFSNRRRTTVYGRMKIRALWCLRH